jgi:hypothetical protein
MPNNLLIIFKIVKGTEEDVVKAKIEIALDKERRDLALVYQKKVSILFIFYQIAILKDRIVKGNHCRGKR